MARESLWALFNLRESPFFQEPLQGGLTPRYPLDLFVARTAEVDRHITWIEAHPSGSRQSIRGPVGVGKSTLAQVIKARAQPLGLLSHPDAISVSTSDTSDELLIRILRYTLDALLTAVPEGATDTSLENVGAVQEARRIVLQYRETTGRSGGISAFGFGASGSRTTTTVTPLRAMPQMLVPPLLIQLRDVASSQFESEGFLIHFDNLENLSESQAQAAPLVMRDLRDLLLVEGFHWLLVGTDDALRIIVDAQPQLRGVFPSPKSLQPLTPDEVITLLQRRYDALRVDGSRPATPPIDADVVRIVYEIHEGDLRGTFGALDLVATELLGLSDRGVRAPLGKDPVLGILQSTVRESLAAQFSPDALAFLRSLTQTFPSNPFTQGEAHQVTGESLADVSNYVRLLLGRDMIRETGTRAGKGRGRRATEYRISRLSALAFGVNQAPEASP